MSSQPRASTLPVSVAVINYNGSRVLPDTMDALEAVRSRCREVVVVDDGSDDGSPEWVEREHPWARVVRFERNTGRLNLVRNRALKEAKSPFVFLMDNDIVVHRGAIEALLETLDRRPEAICCTPRLLYRRDPDRIYHDGGGLHYLCVSRAGTRGATVGGAPVPLPTPTIGCGIMLIARRRALDMGGFDEGYLRGWGDDGEFHLRARLSGAEVLQDSRASCEHVARPHGADRVLGQLYNRYRMLATAYSTRSLVLLAPTLLAFEAALTVASLAGGFTTLRFSALARALADLPEFARRRSEIQSHRSRRDGEILEGGAVTLPTAGTGLTDRSMLVRIAIAASDLYWKLVRRWL